MAERQLPKLHTRVRFPSPAPTLVGRNRMRVVVALMLCAAAQTAAAQYPAKPVRILVPFAAGGVTDIVTRVVAQRMSVDSGAAFLVENKTGASGRISYEAAAKSP